MEQGELIEFQKEVEKASKTMEIMGNLPETLDLLRVGYLWDKCPLGGSIHVGYDGSIYPCEIAANQKMIIGNVRDMALGEALNSEKARMFIDNSRERIEKIEECLECEWKHFCGGGCMVLSLSENDEINSKDYLCGCRKFWLETLIWEKVCI